MVACDTVRTEREELTILAAEGTRQAKRWTHSRGRWGKKTDADTGEWQMHRAPCSSIDDAGRIAEKIHLERTDCALIQGGPSKWNPCDANKEIYRLQKPQTGAVYASTGRKVSSKRLNDLRKAGKLAEELEAGHLYEVSWLPMFEDTPTRVLMFDFDKLPVPPWWNWLRSPREWQEQVARLGHEQLEELGPEFKDVRAWCCLSSSSGHPNTFFELGLRAIVMTDRPLTWPQRRRWFKGKLDTASLRVHQLVYIAAPQMPPGERDPIWRRYGWVDGLHDTVAVPDHVLNYQEPTKRKRETRSLADVAIGHGAGLQPSKRLKRGLEELAERFRKDQEAGDAPEVRARLWAPIYDYLQEVGPERTDPVALADHIGAFVVAAGLRDAGEVEGYGIDRMVESAIAAMPAKPPEPTAALPEYYDRPSAHREVTLTRQRRTIDDFAETAERRRRCLAEAKAKREAAHKVLDDEFAAIEMADRETGSLDFNVDDDHLVAEAERTRKEKAKATRRIRLEAAKKFGFDRFPKKPDRLLVTGSQGTGKTHDTLKSNAQQRAAGITAFLTPTLEKAAEAQRDYDRMSPLRPSILMRGRAVKISEDETMCRRFRIAEKAARAGVEVGKKICPTCPKRDGCAYLEQAERIRELEVVGCVAFGASSYVYTPTPLSKADTVVVDEDVTMKAVNIVTIDPQRVVDPSLWTDDDAAVTAELLVDAKAVLTAVETIGTELECLGLLGIDDEKLAKLATHLRQHQQFVPDVEGYMADAEIDRRIDAVEQKEAHKVLRLITLLKRELKTGRRSTIAAKFDPKRRVMVDCEWEHLPRIVLHTLKRPDNWTAHASMLLLDGTGNRDLAAKVFGDQLRSERFAVERQMHTVQVPKSFSKLALLKSNDSSFQQEQLREFIGRLDKPFVAATAEIEENFQHSGAHGHFGALRGKNKWETCQSAVVVGREQPSTAAIEKIARCFAIDREEPFLCVDRLIECTRRRRMRDPDQVSVEKVEIHPDPLVQSVLEQIREAEGCQAVDRVRPVFNQRSAWLLNRLVVDVTIDEVQDWKAARNGWRGGSRLTEAAARARELGFMPLSGAELARRWPDLWPTAEAARQEFSRADPTVTFSKLDYIGKCHSWIELRYWTSGGSPQGYRAAVPRYTSADSIEKLLDGRLTHLAIDGGARVAADEFHLDTDDETAWREAAE